MNIVITGSSSGLGKCIKELLEKGGHKVFPFDKKDGYDVTMSTPCDFYIINTIKKVDVLVNCAGINFLCPIEQVSRDDWRKVIETNAYGIITMTQASLPYMKRGSKIINIISNASRVPMTHSIVYNASKAAAHIMTRQMARELTRSKGITVIGISPNKMKNTGMSKEIDKQVCKLRGWTPKQAREYQLRALVTGKETDPKHVAELVEFLVTHNVEYMSGCILEAGY